MIKINIEVYISRSLKIFRISDNVKINKYNDIFAKNGQKSTELCH
jgi:hypothetical protein